MILQVSGIEFSYNCNPILNGLTFSVESGSVLGVLGVNGAGKSTLLKCINKILSQKKGCILIDKLNVATMGRSEIARRIGYVPQRHGEDQLTVFDTILLGRKPYVEWSHTERDLEIVERVIQLMGLEKLALRPVTKLSGGEVQKVVLARALAQEPDLLLLDEPTSSLDLKNQLEVMNLVRQVVKDHELAAIISIHDLKLALRFADDFLLLKDGTIHSFTKKVGLSGRVIREVYGVEVVLGEVEGFPVVIPASA